MASKKKAVPKKKAAPKKAAGKKKAALKKKAAPKKKVAPKKAAKKKAAPKRKAAAKKVAPKKKPPVKGGTARPLLREASLSLVPPCNNNPRSDQNPFCVICDDCGGIIGCFPTAAGARNCCTNHHAATGHGCVPDA
jgi:hypothetical protein